MSIILFTVEADDTSSNFRELTYQTLVSQVSTELSLVNWTYNFSTIAWE